MPGVEPDDLCDHRGSSPRSTGPIPKISVNEVPVARTASRISMLIAAKPFV
jgi:hypothetical protein